MAKSIRIMPCLDMKAGRVVKGVQFVNLVDAGDPVHCAAAYCEAGADELGLLDINATVEGRGTMLAVVRAVAAACRVPLTVGGGIADVRQAQDVIAAGADRISVSSAAYRQPELIPELLREIGPEQVIVAMDVDRNPALPSGFEIYVDGGRTATGTDAAEWARRLDDWGVSHVLPTSKATDGARTGYDLPLLEMLRQVTRAELVASGGAGTLAHFSEAARAGASVLLAASVFHFGLISIPELKAYLAAQGVPLANPPPAA